MAKESEKAGPGREVDPLPSDEEKLEDLDLNLIGLKVDSDMQERAMFKEKDIQSVEKSSKH